MDTFVKENLRYGAFVPLAQGESAEDIWGTEWENTKRITPYSTKLIQRAPNMGEWSVWSPNTPPLSFLEKLLNLFPNCWIKCVWNEEGGQGGVWIGDARDGKKEIKHMNWQGPPIEAFFAE